MGAPDVLVLGGGVAGLSAAAALSRDHTVLLLEREALLASHASGRNAAIFRPLERDESSARLARRSLALMAELAESSQPLLQRTGLLLAETRRDQALGWLEHGRAQGVACELLEGAAPSERAPSLEGGQVSCGVLVEDGGVLDVHRLNTTLARAARALGADLRTGSDVASLRVERERIAGVALADGTFLPAGAIVLAAGAFSVALASTCGADLPLVPLRRHLVQLQPQADRPLAADHPVVWRVDDELYYRPESGGVLASPCDEVAWPAGEPQPDPAALETLAAKLTRTAPQLASSRVVRSWACLRTFAPDRELVVGPDERIAGLFWLCGL
ncbi:MAG: NAD(P)/FAD-dependent oxidoreductase, partial [Polyangiales bacterium]